MDLIYSAVKKLTFPGTYIKQIVELLLCLLFKIPAPEPEDNEQEQIKIQTDEAKIIDEPEDLVFDSLGHNEHSEFYFPYKAFLFCFLSTLFNGIIGLIFYYTSVIALCHLDISINDEFTNGFQPMFIVYLLAIYFGICLLSNLFPSPSDINEMWFLCIEENFSITKFLLYLPCLALRFGSFLERYGIIPIILVLAPIYIKVFS